MKKYFVILLSILTFSFSFFACTNNTSKETACTFGEWSCLQEATCEKIGIEVRTCSTCNKSETRILPIIQHNEINGICLYCKKVINAYTAFANYIKENGEYGENKEYFLYLGTTIKYEVSCDRAAWYNPLSKEIIIAMTMDEYYISIHIIENDYNYQYYIKNSSYYMYGILNATTFNENQLYLPYSYTNIQTSADILSFRKLAASSANLLLVLLDEDLNNIHIKPSDLGFLNY